MPVHSLELENFKSYGGVQRIGPFTNFTCVIGPNGSGKSNLMDAASFVLGVQSKALRSQQLQDLIYRQPGTENKKGHKPFGASVTLYYRLTRQEEEEQGGDESETDGDDDDENDSSSHRKKKAKKSSDREDDDDQSSPPRKRRARRGKSVTPSTDGGDDEDTNTTTKDGDDDEGRMLRFGRTISPAGVGEYHLDGHRVTWSAYERALSKLGVLVKARNFLVFQGDVEELARKSEAEYAQLFDVLSGSAALAKDYDKAWQTSQELRQAAELQRQTQKGLRQEKRLLRQQKMEAERFDQLQQDRRELHTQYYLWQLYRIQVQVDSRQDECTEAQERVAALQEEQQGVVESVQSEKKALSKVRRQLAQRQEEDLTRITSLLDTKEPALAAAHSEEADLTKKLTADDKALKKAQNKAQSQEKDVQKLNDELAQAQADLQVLEEEYEKTKEEATRVKWTAAQEEEYEQVKRQAKAASAQHVTKVQQSTQRLAAGTTRESNLQRNLQEAQAQLTQVQGELQSFADRKGKIQQTLEQSKDEMAQTEKSLVTLQRRQRATRERQQELDVQLEQVLAQLRDAKAVLRKNKDEERLIQTVKSLKTFTGGVYGRLADLCRPVQKQFNLAVTVAAGKDMDAIVVDTPQTAQTCIQYLREQRIGTATFLPLSQLQVPSHESTQHLRALLEQDGRFRLAVDVITATDVAVEEYPNVDFRKAVQYAVGNTVVANDLPAARELCFRRNQRIKAVTLQGAVISKAGTMTGGTTRDDKARWKSVEVEKMQAHYDKLLAERTGLDQSGDSAAQHDLEELQNKLGSVRNKATYLQVDLDHSSQQHEERVAQVAHWEKQIHKLTHELKKATTSVAKLEQELEEARQAVVAAEEEHFGPFRERTGLTDLKAYDQAMGKSREEFTEQKRVLTEHMAALQQKRDYEQARDVQKPITRIQARRTERQAALKACRDKQEALQEELEEARADLVAAKEAVAQLEADEQQALGRVKEAQKEMDKAKSATKKATQTVTEHETALERLRAKLHETLQKARVEEVELPLKRDKADSEEENSEESEEDEKGGRRRKTRSQSRRFKRDREEDDDSEESENSGKKSDEDDEDSPPKKRRGPRKKRASAVSIQERSPSPSERSSGQFSSGQVSSVKPTTQFTQDSTRSHTHFSQAENAVVVRDREKAAGLDFSSLPKSLKHRQPIDEKEEKQTRKDFEDKLAKIASDIEAMAPNMKAAEAFETCSEKLNQSSADYEKAKSEAAKATQEFERIKTRRTQLFSDAFEQIDESLKTIYTDMTKSSKHPLGGNAYLSLDDTDEPYKGGLKFNAMPPMKRFRDMEHLSGGEKTVAALSLLFAIHSFRPAPFFIMDEIDAALDNINLRKVCNYIRQRSRVDFQCIVISLKDMFYEQAEALVGICRDAGTNSSRTLTLELTRFDRETLASVASSSKRSSTGSSISTRKRPSSAAKAAAPSSVKKPRRAEEEVSTVATTHEGDEGRQDDDEETNQ